MMKISHCIRSAVSKISNCFVALNVVAIAIMLGTIGLVQPALSTASAAELLMLEQAGCAWCKRWDEEIGEGYPNTDEAKIAPLRRIDIHEPWPDDLAEIAPERFTPTFVLVDDGKEIGRMRGYTGDEFFWFLLNEMLQKLPARLPDDPAGSKHSESG